MCCVGAILCLVSSFRDSYWPSRKWAVWLLQQYNIDHCTCFWFKISTKVFPPKYYIYGDEASLPGLNRSLACRWSSGSFTAHLALDILCKQLNCWLDTIIAPTRHIYSLIDIFARDPQLPSNLLWLNRHCIKYFSTTIILSTKQTNKRVHVHVIKYNHNVGFTVNKTLIISWPHAQERIMQQETTKVH